MQAPNKLGLVKSALHMLVRQARPEDRISIVTYAGTAGIALEPTSGADKLSIDIAIDRLVAGGSTYGQGGLQEAYRLARHGFREDGINRVVLATDGDFNVGISDVAELKRYIEGQREHGISLTALGFGTGNYNDEMLEQLADVGNGNYAYIDNLSEARKVLVEQASSTFQTIASDVKIQIEFNPATVAEYRLVGYANRLLEREEFNNDKVDAGEIGAGHSVTALYEITLVDSEARSIDPLRYGGRVIPEGSDELAFVRLRFKRPGESASELIEQSVLTADMKSAGKSSADLKFASAVAGFGQLLAGDDNISMDYDDVISLAAGSVAGNDAYRSEFLNLVMLAKELSAQVASR
jgi:Ca-activated chloride channel family protein